MGQTAVAPYRRHLNLVWGTSSPGSLGRGHDKNRRCMGYKRESHHQERRNRSVKKSVILAAMLGLMRVAGANASAQQLYWTTSGMFGPFDIRGLIPALPADKSRQITIPVSMWVLDHPKGLVVFDTGNNVAISDGMDNCKKYWAPGNCDF